MHGNGYATEAAQAALKWTGAARRPVQTVCLIHRANRPSLRVAEKIGYVPLRTLDHRGYPAVLLHRLANAATPLQEICAPTVPASAA